MCWECDRLGINQPNVRIVGEYSHFPRSQLTPKNAAHVDPVPYVPTRRERRELREAIPGFRFQDDGSNALFVFGADLVPAEPVPGESAHGARQQNRWMHRPNNRQTQGVVSIRNPLHPVAPPFPNQQALTHPPRSTLTPASRQKFTSAIHCINALSASTSPWIASGARTRYDDLIVAHILQTPFVHASGLFLPFHRHLVHLFEEVLRKECAYTGPLPYWDWSLAWKTASSTTLFDSSESSMGGNGEFVPGRNGTAIVLPGGDVKVIPPATGGGCVKSGPFAEGKWEVRLGPVGYHPQGPDGGLGYNPRCLTRDLNPDFAWGTRPSAVVDILEGCDTLGCFVQELDAPGGVPGGLHASGHWQVGLNALDVFASPSDPVFWLHHAQIDRIWTMWQGQDLDRRTWEVWGTSTAANSESLLSFRPMEHC